MLFQVKKLVSRKPTEKRRERRAAADLNTQLKSKRGRKRGGDPQGKISRLRFYGETGKVLKKNHKQKKSFIGMKEDNCRSIAKSVNLEKNSTTSEWKNGEARGVGDLVRNYPERGGAKKGWSRENA